MRGVYLIFKFFSSADHAVRMAKFSMECMAKFNDLTEKLEVCNCLKKTAPLNLQQPLHYLTVQLLLFVYWWEIIDLSWTRYRGPINAFWTSLWTSDCGCASGRKVSISVVWGHSEYRRTDGKVRRSGQFTLALTIWLN